MYKYKF